MLAVSTVCRLCGAVRTTAPGYAVALVFATSLASGVPCGDALAAGGATNHTVLMEGTSFQPPTLSIKRGDVVTWINKDPFPHTVTAPGVFDSKSIAPGKSWRYTARKSGEIAYTCTFHPIMKGTLKVE
jgi:plastocyanin